MARVSDPRRNWDELSRAAHYNARELAQLCRVSKRHLERLFHRTFGQPPQKWLDEKRLAAAQELLLAGQPIKLVAYELGYKQSSHFCRQFKSHRRMTPSEFIQSAFNSTL